MKRLITLEPEILRTNSAISFHEAGHVALAYHYGFRIGRFRTIPFPHGMGASVQTGLNQNKYQENPTTVMQDRVRQLLAGEITARLGIGLTTKELCLPTTGGLKAECLTQSSPMSAFFHCLDMEPTQNVSPHDLVKVANILNDLEISDWWSWFWEHHQKTLQIIYSHWEIISDLAEMFLLALNSPNYYIGGSFPKQLAWKSGPRWLRPNDWDETTSVVNPQEIFKLIEEKGLTLHDQLYKPTPIRSWKTF